MTRRWRGAAVASVLARGCKAPVWRACPSAIIKPIMMSVARKGASLSVIAVCLALAGCGSTVFSATTHSTPQPAASVMASFCPARASLRPGRACHPVLERAPAVGGGWTRLALPQVASAPDPQLAVASNGGVLIQANSAAGKAGVLLYSLDRGTRWTKEPDPRWDGSPCTSSGLLAAVPNRWWLLCVGGAAAGSSTKGLLRSSDRPRRWVTVSAVTTLTQPPPSGAIPAAEPSALAGASSDQFWLSLQNGLSDSRDGGSLWTDVMGVNPEGFTARFDVVSSSHVWLIAPGTGLWRTTDGSHWSAHGPLNTELAASQAASRSHTAPCRISQLQLAFGPLVSEMTQQDTLVLVLHNVSPTACDLRGYPRIALRGKHGSPLPFKYRDHGDQELTVSPPTTVTVAAGGRAYLAINKNACVERATAVVTRIDVTPPGQIRRLTRALAGHRPSLDYCPSGDPGHTIDITPIEPTLSAAFAKH